MQTHAAQPGWASYAIPLAIVVIVFVIRLRSMKRERPLRPSGLWIVPTIYLVIAASMFVALPPSPLGWALVALAIGVGALVGWQRGKLIRIHRDPETGELRQRSSPLAMLLLVAIVALKFGARAIFGDSASAHPSSGAMLLTDAFVGFALGFLSATRLEIYMRARRIMEPA